VAGVQTILDAFLFIGLTLLLVVAAMALHRRVTSVERLRQHHDVAGFVYAVLGVGYGVLMAFVVSVVWARYDRGEAAAAMEASALVDLTRLTAALDEPARSEAGRTAREYAEAVLDEEWPAMADGRSSERADDLLERLTRVLLAVEPANGRQAAALSEALSRLSAVNDARTDRVLLARSGLPPTMWGVLVVGGVVVIGFAFLFGVPNAWAQAAILVALSGSVGLVLFLIAALDYPFRGAIGVGPEAFVVARAEIAQALDARP
jgi:hypothetical protein